MSSPPDPAMALPAIRVMPLQCPRPNGKPPYKRFEDIDRKIEEALCRPPRDWPELSRGRGSDWMPDQVLVYLITVCNGIGRDAVFGELVHELGLRVAGIAGPYVRGFDKETGSEILDSVGEKVVDLILSNPPCLQGEYLQVAFCDKVEKLTKNARAKRWNRPMSLRRAPVADMESDEEPDNPTDLIEDEGPGPDELAEWLINYSRLKGWIEAAQAAAKDPRHVEAAVLRRRDGWPLARLARRYGKTERTIQDWVESGLEAIRAAVGERK